MKTKNTGVYTFPDTVNRGTATYSVPGMIISNKRASNRKQFKVTHKVYFGENIKRAISTLKSK